MIESDKNKSSPCQNGELKSILFLDNSGSENSEMLNFYHLSSENITQNYLLEEAYKLNYF